MRAVRRTPLSAATTTALNDLTAAVNASKSPKAEAERRWGNKAPAAAFREVRQALKTMAGGLDRCMYCEHNEGTDIEHFWPKGDFPAKAFEWSNYLLACGNCNSNHKRTQFPVESGEPLLLDPSTDDPRQHLRLLPTTGEYQAVGSKGPHSIVVFDLNGERRGRKLRQARRDTLLKLQVLLLDYDRLVATEQHGLAHRTKRAIINEPFSAVLRFLVDLSDRPGAAQVLRAGVPEAIRRHRVAGW